MRLRGLGGTIRQLELKDFDQMALGSGVLFGYRIDAHNSLSAYFEHMSNGYTVDPTKASTDLASATAIVSSRASRAKR